MTLMCVQPFRYSQKQWTAEGARKGPLIHLGKIPVPVKVTGQENINIIQTEVSQLLIRPVGGKACDSIILLMGLSLFFFFIFGGNS